MLYDDILLNEADLQDSKICHDVSVEYYITENKAYKRGVVEELVEYGVEVVMKEHLKEPKIKRSNNFYITKNKEEIDEFSKMIVKNKVIPTELEFIVEDYKKIKE